MNISNLNLLITQYSYIVSSETYWIIYIVRIAKCFHIFHSYGIISTLVQALLPITFKYLKSWTFCSRGEPEFKFKFRKQMEFWQIRWALKCRVVNRHTNVRAKIDYSSVKHISSARRFEWQFNYLRLICIMRCMYVLCRRSISIMSVYNTRRCQRASTVQCKYIHILYRLNVNYTRLSEICVTSEWMIFVLLQIGIDCALVWARNSTFHRPLISIYLLQNWHQFVREKTDHFSSIAQCQHV